MRIPFSGHRNDDQPGGVGSTAEPKYSTIPASKAGKAHIPDGYPSVLVMQRHPVTGKVGSFVYVHASGSGREGADDYGVAEIDPKTGEFLS